MRRNSGFTLIEVIIVIAIMAVISAIAVPNFLSWIPQKRLVSASDELFSNLLYTKMQAIKNNVDWAVTFNYSAQSYTISSDYGGSNTPVKIVNLSSYGSGVRYGMGNATQTVSNGSLANDTLANASDGVTYASPSNIVFFTSRGTAGNLGYVYLTNDFKSSVAVGTPVLAGVVAQRVWSGSTWK